MLDEWVKEENTRTPGIMEYWNSGTMEEWKEGEGRWKRASFAKATADQERRNSRRSVVCRQWSLKGRPWSVVIHKECWNNGKMEKNESS